MAIYRPIKKWALPLLFAGLGLASALSFFPSKQDYIYNEWIQVLKDSSRNSYDVNTQFIVEDDTVYSQSSGQWNESLTYYKVTTPFNDGTSFDFDVYFTKENFYIHAGDSWSYGKMPHRISNEFIPLDHPFNWVKTILQDADTVMKVSDNPKTYQAIFTDFDDIEFRGIRLQQQVDTTLTMEIKPEQSITISFAVQPIRPDEISIFNSYPETFNYSLTLTQRKESSVELPIESQTAEEIQ